MYILFLTFRYLTRKKIVIFPILVVWLCVMMLIIVTSIMGGFVERVRAANRELYGDIIISSGSSSQGFAGYDELTAELRAKFPEVQAVTPVVEAYALLYVPSVKRSVPSLLVGVRPEERSQVSHFRESLFHQYKSPVQAVEDLEPRLPASKADLVTFAREQAEKAYRDAEAARDLFFHPSTRSPPVPAWAQSAWLGAVFVIGLLLFLRAARRRNVWSYFGASIVSLVGVGLVGALVFWPLLFPRHYELRNDALKQADTHLDRALRTAEFANGLPDAKYTNREELARALVPAQPSFDLPAAAKAQSDLPDAEKLPDKGCIVGAQIGFFRRDSRGNFVHTFPTQYRSISITVFPPSRSGMINVNATNAVTQDFTIIDDSHSGVYDVDSLNVYAPFETVQRMAGMRPENGPARTHQLLIRLKPEALGTLTLTRERMDKVTQDFARKYDETHAGAFPLDLEVQTWDEKQARYLGAVKNEKTMLTFIMLLMSGVVLVVIFLIFYMIVRDKTRDIGIIKAVGGSEIGVAAIFLGYGLMIGIVGGGLGVLSGTLFVTHTNEIHEFIYQTTGLLIWDRSVYLFDRIPDVVSVWDIVVYYCVALFAGVVGALIPAILAAFEDPVQAVRYE